MTRFLVAQDDSTGDWTFFSGTCEPRETPRACVVRELMEETNGLITLNKLPRRTKTFRYITENKRIDVFFVPLRNFDNVRQIPAAFDELPRTGNPTFDENRKLRLETLRMFRRRKHVWSLIREVMSTEEFLETMPPRSL